MFSPRYKTFCHAAQVIIIILVLAFAGYRMANQVPGVPTSTGDRMSLAMGAKALVVILYQVVTEYVARFHRWASLKANLILNCLEIVFWAAVGGLSMQSLNRFCGDGAVCAVGWINGVLAFVLCFMAIYVSILSYKEFKGGKRAGLDGSYRSSSVPLQKGGSGRSEV